MDDATLVEAARRGDQAAWADIYDRYADRLHDHCHRILRDRDEAADALHDAFIAASQHLDQLRDPARVRPWLYSICRYESLRRVRLRSRVELTADVGEMTGVEADLDRSVRSEELQELVWSAAAGLSARDQTLLDLSVRQGLDGQDLADAMGTSLNNSYVMLSRLRDQIERSLGALLIARLGREDCEELDAILEGWDGRFSPLLRKRVARHVDDCDVCRERRAAVASPMALLAATPIVPAPRALRGRVLDGISAGDAPRPIRFTRDGFAAPEGAPAASRSAWWAAAAVVAVVGLVGMVLAVTGGDDPTPLAAIGPTTTTTEATSTTTTTEAPTSTTTTTVATTTSTTDAVSPPPGTDPDAPPDTDEPVVIPPPPADTTPPAISNVTQSASFVRSASCSGAGPPTTVTVSATITDASPFTAKVVWSGTPGNGEEPMTPTATFGDFPTGGDVTYRVVATDAAGNTTTSSARTLLVQSCPP